MYEYFFVDMYMHIIYKNEDECISMKTNICISIDTGIISYLRIHICAHLYIHIHLYMIVCKCIR
jgi:hypothetical protein